jgi:hypothetical protein
LGVGSKRGPYFDFKSNYQTIKNQVPILRKLQNEKMHKYDSVISIFLSTLLAHHFVEKIVVHRNKIGRNDRKSMVIHKVIHFFHKKSRIGE